MNTNGQIAVVTGFSPGFGDAVARRFAQDGTTVVGLSRSPRPGLGSAARVLEVDLADVAAVAEAFALIDRDFGAVSTLVHNAAQFSRGAFLDTTPAEFERTWRASTLSAVNCCHQAIPRMLAQGGGTIILSGATASVRASAGFAPFTSAKFALRALAGSLAREFSAQNVHVVHAIIDGIIWSDVSKKRFDGLIEDQCINVDDIADAYWQLAIQPRSCWSHEVDFRPNAGKF
ncbi:SDR family NAD(P)-dependent oxidoreductase [Sphingomonas alba]|uniref:SDR family NAD(P)-dependent oxidoreductase n=1 Tax=Sphingomonas alba TaxID=2908208 RepID=A0ABT0RKQ2_9SPHN|nr:SDR family NAD(P)-dependent oxidoreductase [Sphingomonas alba]MCL6683214.1 SDR family NAD(P)-dependent oxidoreductase [Sphingomonas alba]